MNFRIIAATGALVALAGCSATTTASKSTTATTTAITAVTTTAASSITPPPVATTAAPKAKPVVWTLHEAGLHYLALVKPGNTTLDKINAAIEARPQRFDTAIKLAGLVTRQDATFIHGLTNGHWPAVVRPQIKTLIAAMLPERLAYEDASHAHNWSDWNTAMALTSNKSSVAGSQIRLTLGLPLN